VFMMGECISEDNIKDFGFPTGYDGKKTVQTADCANEKFPHVPKEEVQRYARVVQCCKKCFGWGYHSFCYPEGKCPRFDSRQYSPYTDNFEHHMSDFQDNCKCGGPSDTVRKAEWNN